MIYLFQYTTEWFNPFARVIFSRNFAYGKFRKNKTRTKISDFTVYNKNKKKSFHEYVIDFSDWNASGVDCKFGNFHEIFIFVNSV